MADRNEDNNAPVILTRQGLQEFFGVTRDTIQRWRRAGAPIRKRDRRLVGDPVELEAWLDETDARKAGRRRTAKAERSADRVEDEPELSLLDPELLKPGAEVDFDLDDPAAELKSAAVVLRRLDRIFRAFDIERLNNASSLKSFLGFAEGFSRTLARVAKARDDLIAIKIKAGNLLEQGEVEGAFAKLAEIHNHISDTLPDRVVREVMSVLSEAGIPPSFDSDLLKDRLDRVLMDHRRRLADAVEEAAHAA